jgi:DNA-binding response OmpR family regulator
MRVLILDDDEDLLATLQEILQADGFDVTTCSTVQNATSALEAKDFQVVVTDLGLRQTGGLAFCEQLSKEHPELPIVVLTGYGEARSAALRLGARKVLVKPVGGAELKRVLQELVPAQHG